MRSCDRKDSPEQFFVSTSLYPSTPIPRKCTASAMRNSESWSSITSFRVSSTNTHRPTTIAVFSCCDRFLIHCCALFRRARRLASSKDPMVTMTRPPDSGRREDARPEDATEAEDEPTRDRARVRRCARVERSSRRGADAAVRHEVWRSGHGFGESRPRSARENSREIDRIRGDSCIFCTCMRTRRRAGWWRSSTRRSPSSPRLHCMVRYQ